MQMSTIDDEATRLPSHRLWRNRDFLLLWSGQLVSTLGSNISTLALPVLVLALTNAPAQAGLIAAAGALPYLLLSLPAGAFLDRWDRKAVMIRCDAARGVAYGSVPVAAAVGHLTLAHLYAVALIGGMANVLFGLAQVSALPRVVSRAHLSHANALNEGADQTGLLLGPVVGGVIIALARSQAIGAVLAFLVDSLSYLVSVLTLGLIRTPFEVARQPVSSRSLRAEIAEGLRFLWAQRRLRIMALLTTSVNFFFSPIYLAIVVLVKDLHALHLAAPGRGVVLGLVVGAGGGGGVLGALLAPWLHVRLRFGQVTIGAVTTWAAAAAVVAGASSPVVVGLGWAVLNLAWPVYAVTLVSYRLAATPDHLQGRVNSAFRVLSYGVEPLGMAAGGLLLGVAGPRVELWIIAGGLAASVLAVGVTEVRYA